MSDWFEQIKQRMKGGMLSVSMSKGVKRDMDRLIGEVERREEMNDNCCEHCEACTQALTAIVLLLTDIKAVMQEQRIMQLIDGKHTVTRS